MTTHRRFVNRPYETNERRHRRARHGPFNQRSKVVAVTNNRLRLPIQQLIRSGEWELGTVGLIFPSIWHCLQFYRLYSVYLIGNAIPDTNALANRSPNINLLIPACCEGAGRLCVLAIFFFVGKGLQNRRPGTPSATSLTIILAVSVVLAAVLFFTIL